MMNIWKILHYLFSIYFYRYLIYMYFFQTILEQTIIN